MTENNVELLHIEETLLEGSVADIKKLISRIHKADIADALEKLSRQQRIDFFKKVKPELVTDIFEEIEKSKNDSDYFNIKLDFINVSLELAVEAIREMIRMV